MVRATAPRSAGVDLCGQRAEAATVLANLHSTPIVLKIALNPHPSGGGQGEGMEGQFLLGDRKGIAEVATRDGIRSYITNSIPREVSAGLSMQEAGRLWVRRRIDAGQITPGVVTDQAFEARMAARRHMF